MTKVPIPPGGNAEGTADYNCDSANQDCHLLVYQGSRLYELYKANIPNGQASGDPLTATCEVVWDLTHDYWQPGTPYSRGDQCTSADAAGMPMAPLLATGAELQAGTVPHALRFTLPNGRIRSGVYLHPGTHAGNPTGYSSMPAYVSRFRLRSDFDMSSLPNDAARAVARALQVYGMFLDDGGNVPLTLDQSAAPYLGSHDLQALAVTDFEIVASPDPPVTKTNECQRTPITQ
jgi:serine/threonine-protein kinase